jgi:hypothetical protein
MMVDKSKRPPCRERNMGYPCACDYNGIACALWAGYSIQSMRGEQPIYVQSTIERRAVPIRALHPTQSEPQGCPPHVIEGTPHGRVQD